MTLLKILFVLLILIPIAIIMMYIIDNLSKEAKRAKDNTVDFEEVRRSRSRTAKPALKDLLGNAAKNKSKGKAKKKQASEPVKKRSKPTSGRQKTKRREPAAARQPSGRPAPKPISPPLQDNSRQYIEEYNRKRAEIENNSRHAGRRYASSEFDMLYGDGAGRSDKTNVPNKSSNKPSKKHSRTNTGKKSGRRRGKS